VVGVFRQAAESLSMPKRPDTLETVLLAVELLQRIPRGRKITASELHDQLNDAGIKRELRTIQRQLEMLAEHFEIERDERNKPYGYRWLDHARGLTLPHLTTQESLLLGLAGEYLKNLLPARLMKSMDGFFAQARRNLGPDANARLEREWPGKVRVVATSQPLLPPRIAPGVFETVSEALYGNRWLHLDYRNANGKRAEVEVMPLGLAQQGPRLYLVCRYRGYENERSLALHRILSAKASTLTFERPKDFDLKKYDDDGRFGFGDGQRIRLTFRIDKKAGLHLTESPLSADQQAVEINGEQLEISATVVDSAMLEWWLRGFGEAVSEVRRCPIVEITK
jgi:predicted DNA-binding transcriptional regulator YafY